MRPNDFYNILHGLVDNFYYQKRLLGELKSERHDLKGKMIENEKNLSYREKQLLEAKAQLDEFLNTEFRASYGDVQRL